MKLRIASGILAVAMLGFSWAQSPVHVTGIMGGPAVAYAAPETFNDFAWDDPAIRADGVGDSPLVP